MGYKTKVQLIKRAKSEQWYISLPTQLAAAMEFKQSETVEWFVEDKATLALKRHDAPGQILSDQERNR
jgi:post-segregation antitoxin (ccd killing protein)